MKRSDRQGKRFMLPRGTDVFLRQLRVVIEGVVAACIICAAEKTVFSSIDLPFLNPAAPSVSLAFVIAVGFLMGKTEGGVCGLFTGFLCEGAVESGLFIYPLIYFVCGYLSGVAVDKILSHNLPSFMIHIAVGAAFLSVGETARLAFEINTLPVGILASSILPRALLTLIFAIPTYLLTLLYVNLRMREKR